MDSDGERGGGDDTSEGGRTIGGRGDEDEGEGEEQGDEDSGAKALKLKTRLL